MYGRSSFSLFDVREITNHRLLEWIGGWTEITTGQGDLYGDLSSEK
jgi:hypothetical protein